MNSCLPIKRTAVTQTAYYPVTWLGVHTLFLRVQHAFYYNAPSTVSEFSILQYSNPPGGHFLIRRSLSSPLDLPETFRSYGFYPPRISATFRLNFGGIVFLQYFGSIFSLA